MPSKILNNMKLTVQLNELLKNKPGYYHWSELILFFDKNEDVLTNEQKRKIFYRCEKYREQHNKLNPSDIIRREDTKANMYSDLSYLEEKNSPEVNELCCLQQI